MRSILVISAVFAMWACGNESKSGDSPPKTLEKNQEPAPDPTPAEQPTGDELRVEVGDCYGDGGDGAHPHYRRATDRIRAARDGLTACYRAALNTTPERFAGITVSFTLDTTGKPRGAEAAGSDDAELSACVAKHVESLSLGPADAELAVSCRLALGYAPVKQWAQSSKRLDLKAEGALDWSDAGQLPIIRAEPDVPASALLREVAAARAAGIEHLAFETRRKGEWKFAYLPILPDVEPKAPTGRVELSVFLEAGRVRVGDTAGKRWKIPHAGKQPNFAMLSDVLKARKRKPDFEHRGDVQLAPAADVAYGDVARVMSLLSAQEFTQVSLLAWPDAAVKLDAPKEQ